MIRDYGQLIDALVARRLELGLSQADVDEKAGFCERYTSKVEAWRGKNGRGMGILTLPLLLETLGVALVLVPLEKPSDPKPRRPLTPDEHRLRVRRGSRRKDRRFRQPYRT